MMKLSIIQMDMRPGESAYNFAHAEALLRRAAAGETVFGGAARTLGPRGELHAAAGAGEEIITAALDFSIFAEVRAAINVFHDRRPELYRI